MITYISTIHGRCIASPTAPRLSAATYAGIGEVAVVERSFEGWDAALAYAIARQRDRRNLTKQQVNAFIAHVVQYVSRGGF